MNFSPNTSTKHPGPGWVLYIAVVLFNCYKSIPKLCQISCGWMREKAKTVKMKLAKSHFLHKKLPKKNESPKLTLVSHRTPKVLQTCKYTWENFTFIRGFIGQKLKNWSQQKKLFCHKKTLKKYQVRKFCLGFSEYLPSNIDLQVKF